MSEPRSRAGGRGISFLNSAATTSNIFRPPEQFATWFAERKAANHFAVDEIAFADMDAWFFEEDSGDLVHCSGKYFRIEGLEVTTTFGDVNRWHQPIINQPEIGILGLLTRETDGVRYFLMQAKMEPGNPNLLQLSPTVQATRSNYTQVHQGRRPPYLDFFLHRERCSVLVDQLQTEQGGRFLRKRNRNMIIEIDAATDIDILDDFCWLTLYEIKQLLHCDNVVNMDARSVLSCIPLVDQESQAMYAGLRREDAHITPRQDEYAQQLVRSLVEVENAEHSLETLVSWFTELKTLYELRVERVPLKDLPRWSRDSHRIAHSSGAHFSVLAVSVEAGSREVSRWSQPLVADPCRGLIGFVLQQRRGLLHFLVQAKVEPGNIDVVEMAPTVSCANVRQRRQQGTTPPFLDVFLNATAEQLRYSSVQSEEGGRFFHFENRYMSVQIDAGETLDLPKNYAWMTLGQLLDLARHGYLNIETRSLLACAAMP